MRRSGLRVDYPAQVSSSITLTTRAKPQHTKPDTNQATRTCSTLSPLQSPNLPKIPQKLPQTLSGPPKTAQILGPPQIQGVIPKFRVFSPNSGCFSLLQNPPANPPVQGKHNRRSSTRFAVTRLVAQARDNREKSPPNSQFHQPPQEN